YRHAQGTERRMTLALFWLHAAAERDMGRAQFALGFLYGSGTDLPQDWAKAAAWYESPARNGVAEACANLAVMHANGVGTEPDLVRGLMWMTIAAAASERATQASPTQFSAQRDLLFQRVSAGQASEAAKLANEWMHAHWPSASTAR